MGVSWDMATPGAHITAHRDPDCIVHDPTHTCRDRDGNTLTGNGKTCWASTRAQAAPTAPSCHVTVVRSEHSTLRRPFQPVCDRHGHFLAYGFDTIAEAEAVGHAHAADIARLVELGVLQ